MTYRQPPVCRKDGCPRPAVPDEGLVEGDRRLCEQHLAEVRALRAELWKPMPTGRPATPPSGRTATPPAGASTPAEKKHPTLTPAYPAGWL